MSPTTGPGDLRESHWQAVLDDYQADRRLPTLVAGVLLDGELAWSGSAFSAVARPADVQHRIGSITKTMTAVLVLQCHEEGLLGLEDRLGEWVPESGYRDATVRALLSHTSGMQSEPAGPWWERSPGSPFDALVGANDGSGAVFEPRQRFHYSNLGFALLGEVVARLRGTSWVSVLGSRLLEPMGMIRTTLLPEAPHATGLSVDHLAGTLTPEPATDTLAMAPAGQLWSTVSDLARFAPLLSAGAPGVLSAASAALMVAPDTVAGDYGLGVQRSPHDGLADGRAGDRHERAGDAVLVGHPGSMPGFQSGLFLDPATGAGVVSLTNATTGFRGAELTERLLAGPTPAPARPWVPTREVPGWGAELLGWWFWGNSCFEARWENDQLQLRDLARGEIAERFEHRDGRIVGVEGYHAGETLHVERSDRGGVRRLECATFVYTRVPYPGPQEPDGITGPDVPTGPD